MKRIFYILIFFVIFGEIQAQNDSGVITFERRTFWVNINSKLPWMTQEEIDRDRLTWGGRQSRWTEQYSLHFNGDASLYQEIENEDARGFGRRDGQFILFRDFAHSRMEDYRTLVDKDYKITGDMPRFKWKIHNEIKEIQGYLCMKAETTDPVKNVPVYAWFTDQIPVSGGPEGYGGLPGMILSLEIDGNCALIDATRVELNREVNLEIPGKPKGKEISQEEFFEITRDNIQKAYERKRNPFWFIRY